MTHPLRTSARRRADQRRGRESHPRAGELVLTLSGRTARGDEHVAKQLARYLDDRVAVLHDRRIPGSRETIDHLAIAPSGVWVVASDRGDGPVAVSKPLLHGRARLLIEGRDETPIVERLTRHAGLVELAIPADVPVHGALCFADGRLPVLHRRAIEGHALLDPRALARRIDVAGPLTDAEIRATVLQLVRRFPRA